MRDLYNIIQEYTGQPLTPLGRRSINAFEALPAAKDWEPDQFFAMEVSRIFDLGLPLTLINNTRNSKKIREVLSANLAGKIQTSDIESTLAELHACALLNALGLPADFVARSTRKTPDLRFVSEQGQVDVEVAYAEKKAVHEEARAYLGDFIGGIQPGELENDIAFYFIDVNNGLHRSQAFDAAMTLVPGEVVSCENCWLVAQFIDSVETDFHSKLAALQPHWWPKSSASFVATGVWTGSPPRYVYFKTAPPAADYINPIRRKAEKFQGTAGVPFVIALEGSNLPNVYLQIENEVDPYWRLWEHVSGIMVYEPRFWTVGTRKTYVWKLLKNPYASNPLPMLFPVSTGDNEKLDMYILEPEKSFIWNA